MSEIKNLPQNNKIFIVDDDFAITETLKELLQFHGYNVEVASNGYDAIDRINKNDFNFVLLDIKMPEINGVETYKRIKLSKPSLRVVLMTAYSPKELIDEAIDEGVYKVIFKPFKINKLIKLIEENNM